MLSVIILSVIMLNVTCKPSMPNAVMLSVVMLNVVVPQNKLECLSMASFFRLV
jgi:hypothetical protein